MFEPGARLSYGDESRQTHTSITDANNKFVQLQTPEELGSALCQNRRRKYRPPHLVCHKINGHCDGVMDP